MYSYIGIISFQLQDDGLNNVRLLLHSFIIDIHVCYHFSLLNNYQNLYIRMYVGVLWVYPVNYLMSDVHMLNVHYYRSAIVV